MEIGYADNTFPMTYEGLDRIFLDDILKLVKEQNDAEDAENARHREVSLSGTSFLILLTSFSLLLTYIRPN